MSTKVVSSKLVTWEMQRKQCTSIHLYGDRRRGKGMSYAWCLFCPLTLRSRQVWTSKTGSCSSEIQTLSFQNISACFYMRNEIVLCKHVLFQTNYCFSLFQLYCQSLFINWLINVTNSKLQQAMPNCRFRVGAYVSVLFNAMWSEGSTRESGWDAAILEW